MKKKINDTYTDFEKTIYERVKKVPYSENELKPMTSREFAEKILPKADTQIKKNKKIKKVSHKDDKDLRNVLIEMKLVLSVDNFREGLIWGVLLSTMVYIGITLIK